MLRVNNLVGFGRRSGSAIDPIPENNFIVGLHQYSASGASSKTFSNVDIGAPAANRYVIVTTAHESASGAASVTVNGVSASRVANINGDGGANLSAAVHIAAVPTGTLVDVDITYSGGTPPNNVCGIYVVYNLSSTTPTDSGTVTINSSGAINFTGVVVDAGGVFVGIISNVQSMSGCTWTNATQDFVESEAAHASSGGYAVGVFSGSITAQKVSGGAGRTVGAFACFR